MFLESEIDSENQARFQQMSAEEVTEAKADIMKKISPALHKVLQRRGREKLKKPDSFKSQLVIVSESVNPYVQTTQEAKRLQEEDKNDKNVSRKTSTTTQSVAHAMLGAIELRPLGCYVFHWLGMLLILNWRSLCMIISANAAICGLREILVQQVIYS